MILHITNFVFCIIIAVIQGYEICDHLGILPYEEIGCTPTLGPTGCPKSFDCAHYIVPNDTCIFKGQIYQDNENVNGTAPCNPACICSIDETFGPSINCAVYDCNWNVFENCYQTYDLDSCCPSGQKCPPFDDSAICQVDGKTYKEGQHFQPEGQCLSCVCQKGFTGEFVEPFCRRIQCDVEIRFAKEISENCAPAYIKTADALCCPIHYICPSKTLNITVVENTSITDDKCVFGELEFNINDIMNLTYNIYEEKVAECSCILPPSLTCKSDY